MQHDDDSDKSYEATPQKLEKTRKKGEVAKSNDLISGGRLMRAWLACSCWLRGQYMVRQHLGNLVIVVLIDQSDQDFRNFADRQDQRHSTLSAGILEIDTNAPVATLFIVPAAAVSAEPDGPTRTWSLRRTSSSLGYVAHLDSSRMRKNKFGREWPVRIRQELCD